MKFNSINCSFATSLNLLKFSFKYLIGFVMFLVISKRHFVTLLDIPNKLGNEMLEFTKKVASKLMDDKYGDGFNLIMNNLEVAGQVVMHVHVHVLPRKEDDGRIRFIPKSGNAQDF